MEPFSCLAVDMGAASIRVVEGIFSDRFEMVEVHRFENRFIYRDGAERWDLNAILEGINTGIDKALAQSQYPVLSIGVDSWGVDFVLLDEKGKPVEDPVSYRDARTQNMRYVWERKMSGQETFDRTGINYNIFNTLYQLLSIKDSEVLLKTHRLLFMADYVNYFLSGVAVNELSLAATSQLVNSMEKAFDQTILDHLLPGKNIFGTPVMAGTILRTETEIQLNKPEVIVVAGHDTASAVASIPFTSINSAFISTGTWCIVGMLSDEPLKGKDAFMSGVTNEVTHDGKFRPSLNLIGLWLIQQLRQAFHSSLSFAEIEQMATTAPESDFLIDTSDAGFFNPSDMKVAFDRFLLEHYHKRLLSEAAYYRCAYDSLAESFRKALSDFERICGKTFDVVHVFGGGSRSELLCRLTAKATRRKVIAGPVEASVIGNLMVQSVALGKFSTYEEAKQKIYQSVELQVYLP
jgi:rhamnulokinase